MKQKIDFKSIVAIFATSTLFACTQDVMDSLPTQTESNAEPMKELSKHRTYEEALAVAQEAIGMLGESCVTRSGKPRTVSTDDVQYIVNRSSTRSNGEPDTLMYVFNYEDNAGFAVVSANRATEDLIAVTEQGNYVVGEETGNGGLDLYMDMAEEYVMRAFEPIPPIGGGGDDDGPEDFHEYVRVDRKRIIYSYGPYVDVRWGQQYPYNQYCITNEGNTIAAGCLTTALAQVISYYEYPTQLTINYDGGSTILPLNWNEIKKHMSALHYTCTCTEHETIGKMFRQLGYELWIDYKNGKSGNPGGYIDDALSILGYTYGNSISYSSSVVESSLSQSKLVYITGFLSANEDGHAWVIDGFKKVETTRIDYARNTVTGEMIEIWRGSPSINCYNHFNWGWNGNSNGYYLTNVFDVTQYSELDFGVTSTATYNFTYNIKIIPNITH